MASSACIRNLRDYIALPSVNPMGRSDMPENERSDFFLYVDEFQNFATDSFATILSEARKNV